MPCHKTITTAPFAIERRTLTRLLTRRLAARRWFAVALPFMILLAVGICLDTAYVFVALMYLFLIVPTLVMISYFNEILRVSAIRSTYTQTVTIIPEENRLTVIYNDIKDNENRARIDLSAREYTVNLVKNTIFTAKHILIRTARHEYIIIPTNAFEQSDLLEFESFVMA